MWRAARRWIRGYESSNTPAQSAPRNSRRFTESAPIFFRSGRRRRPPTAIAGTPAHVAGRSDSKSQSLRRPRTPDSGLSRQARSPPRMSPALRHSRAMDPTLLAESDPRDRYVLVPGFCRLLVVPFAARQSPGVRIASCGRLGDQLPMADSLMPPLYAGNATANRTPSARMISLFSSPTGQSCS